MFDVSDTHYPQVLAREFEVKDVTKKGEENKEHSLVVEFVQGESKPMSQARYQANIQAAYGQRSMNAILETEEGNFAAVQLTGGPICRYHAKNEDRIRYANLPAAVSLQALTQMEREQVMSATFHRLDQEVKEAKIEGWIGSTLSMVVQDEKSVTCGYVGDSPVIVIRMNKQTGKYSFKVLTSTLHHPRVYAERPEESIKPDDYKAVLDEKTGKPKIVEGSTCVAEAIGPKGEHIQYNSTIRFGRIDGALALTRAIGDCDLEKAGKTADPDVVSWDVPPSEEEVDIILTCSDGVTENDTSPSSTLKPGLKYKEICEMVAVQIHEMYREKNLHGSSVFTPASISARIAQMAAERSTDNISVSVQIRDPLEMKSHPRTEVLVMADGHGGREVADLVEARAIPCFCQQLLLMLKEKFKDSPMRACEYGAEVFQNAIERKGRDLKEAERLVLAEKIMTTHRQSLETSKLLVLLFAHGEVKEREELLAIAQKAILHKNPAAFDCIAQKGEKTFNGEDMVQLSVLISQAARENRIDSAVAGQFFISLAKMNTPRGFFLKRKPLYTENAQGRFVESAMNAGLDEITLYYVKTKVLGEQAAQSSDAMMRSLPSMQPGERHVDEGHQEKLEQYQSAPVEAKDAKGSTKKEESIELISVVEFFGGDKDDKRSARKSVGRRGASTSGTA